jgi:microcompartment protein CcmL/EutN
MTLKALGLIETIGLPAAITAADAAVKAANVTLLGRETAKGGGRITIKLAGDVGAVKAAVAAGAAAAALVGRVDGTLVIPRPHEQLEVWINRSNPEPGEAAAAPERSAHKPAEPPEVETDHTRDRGPAAPDPPRGAPDQPVAEDQEVRLQQPERPAGCIHAALEALQAAPSNTPEACRKE